MAGTNGDGPERGPIERKVQMTGGSTYTVSIPKPWAKARGIGSGSPLHLYPFEDRLVVAQPDDADGASVRRATIDVDAVDEETLAGRIEAAYAAGSDEIVVESDAGFSTSQRRTAGRAITDLVGMEIATETERRLLATSLLDTTEISLDGTIEQLRGIALSMQETAVEAAFGDGSGPEPRHIVSRDDDVDRLFALVSRQFYRVLAEVREIDRLRTDRSTAFTQFRIARQLERIADHAEGIADVADRLADAPPDELGSAFETAAADARRVVRTALDDAPDEALSRRDELAERLEALDRRLYESHREDVYLYGRILESVRRTAEYGANIAEIRRLSEMTDRA
jgi:phosphate uptake regulator